MRGDHTMQSNRVNPGDELEVIEVDGKIFFKLKGSEPPEMVHFPNDTIVIFEGPSEFTLGYDNVNRIVIKKASFDDIFKPGSTFRIRISK